MGIRSRLKGTQGGVHISQPAYATSQKQEETPRENDGYLPVAASPVGTFDNAVYNLALQFKRSHIGPKGSIRKKLGF